jgi:hypothetical protein
MPPSILLGGIFAHVRRRVDGIKNRGLVLNYAQVRATKTLRYLVGWLISLIS